MKDYTGMPYHQLKQVCAELGISAQGTKDQLLERLKNTKSPEMIQTEEIEANTPEGPQKEIAMPDEGQPYAPEWEKKRNDQRYAAWIANDRLERLQGQLREIANGKGTAEFTLDHEGGAYFVTFDGKLQSKVCTTLIDSDAQILKEARIYFNARMRSGKNKQVSGI